MNVDALVERLIHCAVGHGNDEAFIADYFRSELRDFADDVERESLDALNEAKDEALRLGDRVEELRKRLHTLIDSIDTLDREASSIKREGL